MATPSLLGGRYRLGPVIGSGGMGAVHRARDERLGREVAVKVLLAGAGAQEAERLRREARYLAALRHPNLVAVLDAGADSAPDGETVWFAMELVHGPDLSRVLDRSGPIDAAAARRVLAGSAAALTTLHAAGMVHRDLKPGNLLLTAHPDAGEWDVKLADLGIAHLLRSDRLTSTGQVIGTVAYLSPEQVAGREVGTASDVYSLGLLLLEALTGDVAFPGPVGESAAARLVRAPDVPRWIDGNWRTLLTAMTALDPERRPTAPRIAAVASGLPDLPAAPPIAPTAALAMHTVVLRDATPTVVLPSPLQRPATVTARPRRRSRLVLGAASVLVAVLLAGGGFALLQSGATGTQQAQAAPVTRTPSHRTASQTPSTRPTAVAAMPSAPPASAPATSPPPEGIGERLHKARQDLRRSIDHWRHALHGLGGIGFGH